MLTIINNNTDPRFNLAVEEYVLKFLNLDEDFILIWQNNKCVIIGKHQNPYKDLNLSFTNKNNIPIIRRTTDGDAIYHDLGNINFAFVTKNTEIKNGNHKIFLKPVVDVLLGMGINASIKNKTDIYIGKDKIALNYQNTYKDKMIHHGIIFVDSKLQYNKLIKIDNADNLVNVKKHFKQQMTVSMFKVLFLHEILEGEVGNKVYTLDNLDKGKINQLMEKKYNNWDWNYGETKEFLIKREYDKRMLVTLIIKRGFISDVTVDSFENTIKIEKALLNIRFDEESLRKVFTKFKKVDTEQMIETLMY